MKLNVDLKEFKKKYNQKKTKFYTIKLNPKTLMKLRI